MSPLASESASVSAFLRVHPTNAFIARRFSMHAISIMCCAGWIPGHQFVQRGPVVPGYPSALA